MGKGTTDQNHLDCLGHDAAETLLALRDRQLSRGLRALSVAGLFLVVLSLSRVFLIGWHPAMAFHIVAYLTVLCLAFLHGRLSFAFRANALMGVVFAIGVAGILSWGLAALSLQAFFVICILSTVFSGRRAGMIATAASIVAVGTVGLLVHLQIVTFDFDVHAYLTSFPVWLLTMAAMAMPSLIVVRALGALNGEIEGLIGALHEQNREMAGVIGRLEREIAERALLEEERLKLERGLERAKKMETLGTMAGGVAHDLNNILVGAVSYPDLLLAQLPPESHLRGPMETIKKSGVKAAAIVQDLLTLARRGVATMNTVNLNSIIADYLSSPEYEKLKSFYPRVEVEFKPAEGLPNIVGSPVHLFKAVMNLVSNAAEAIPTDEGRIIVATRKERTAREGVLESTGTDDCVVLTVSDTGTGIARDDLDKIFEPFYTKKAMGRSGTGLGMAVVWGTVKDHRGHIDVESTLGAGTTFTLYFPVTEEKVAEIREPLSYKEYMGKGESILIVDDVKEQREIAATMLRELGYQVSVVSSGEEALAHLGKTSIDLLVLDMYMDPGIDGLETYRKALRLKPRQKAIIASGYTETWRVKEARKLGAGAFVRKPFFLNEIGMAIRAELDSRQGHRDSRN